MMLRGLRDKYEEAHRSASSTRPSWPRPQPLEPLHLGPPAARQGRRPARHRRRAREDRASPAGPTSSRTAMVRIRALERERDAAAARRGRRRRTRTPARIAAPGAGASRRRRRHRAEARGTRGSVERDAAARVDRGAQADRRRRRAPTSRRRLEAALEEASVARSRQVQRRRAAGPRSTSTPDVVAQVVADWTGIPVGKMVQDEAARHAEPRGAPRPSASRGRTTPSRRVAEGIRAAKAGLANPATRRSASSSSSARAASARPRPALAPGRPAVRRRALHDHHQHVRVPGEAHRLAAHRLAARLRRATARAAC